MRLLQHHPEQPGVFTLTEDFVDEKIPRYVILSHTWGPDHEEVTFKELVDGDAKARDKVGYKKLKFCADAAKRDGLKHFWVDTCCIDKTNAVELSHAINSMFRWYQKSERCYVYLSKFSGNAEDPKFREHRWFTRGWTLQELIAPKSVEFFNSDDMRIGDRISLERQIHSITGIATRALQGAILFDFDVEERFKWADTRQTTREEDWAYCLLGIFGVNMPLIYGEGRANAVRRLKREISHAASYDNTTHHKAVWMVPFERNTVFTGRDAELTALRKKLFAAKDGTSRVAVTGLGGVGKTQLVLELLYRIRDEYQDCSVLWISATSMESLEQGYLSAAKKLGIPGCENKDADVKQLVQDHLSNDGAGQWLLIIDNADDPDIWTKPAMPGAKRLLDYVPMSSRGSIVVTSRNTQVAVKFGGPEVFPVREMDETESINLLRERLVNKLLVEQHREDAKSLLSQLVYLPLAIGQAAAYINANGIDFKHYLSIMGAQEQDMIDLLSEDFEEINRYRDTKNPVATTWLISFESIRQQDTLASNYLSFMACVDSKDIPLSMLLPASSKKQETDALGLLQGYSFITKQADGSAVTLHRLVHLAMRAWLKKKDLLQLWNDRVSDRLSDLLYEVDLVERTIWRSYMPHASYFLNSIDKEKLINEYRRAAGQNKRSSLLGKTAAKLTKVLGPKSPDKRAAWKSKMPRALLAVQSPPRREESEEDLPGWLRLFGCYALCLFHEGRYKEAEELFSQSVQTTKELFVEDHWHTLWGMTNLAAMYRQLGRWQEAEELEVRVLETHKSKFGEDHPDTFWAMRSLAATYAKQGRLDEAEKLQQKVLRAQKISLGVDHHETLQTMHNLAATYSQQGRFDEAEKMELQTLEKRKTSLGVDHPETLLTMHNLAVTYLKQRRFDEAEKMLLQVLETRKRLLGMEHPNTLNCMESLARTWREQDRNEDALRLGEDCLNLRERTLGADHPDTIQIREDLERWRRYNN